VLCQSLSSLLQKKKAKELTGEEQLVLDKENIRAKIENKNRLPCKKSPINQKPITPIQNCQQES
jgi:hypothetical protein